VQRAIAELGYIQNMTAGSLAGARSRIVSVLVPGIANSIFNEATEQLETELVAGGDTVMLGMTGGKDEKMLPHIHAALRRRVDAIIITGIISSPEARSLLSRRPITVIETWGLPDDPIDISIGFSHEAIGAALAEFARERGYRRPHLITARGSRAPLRRNGFVAAWTSAGGAPPTESMVDIPSRFGHARGAFREINALDPRPDLIVTGSDWLAQGLVLEARIAGMRVPDDLGVIGFGNLAIAGEMRPTITTVDVHGAQIGRETIKILRTRAEGGTVPARHIDTGFEIIARESA